jgi:hypothetical protein
MKAGIVSLSGDKTGDTMVMVQRSTGTAVNRIQMLTGMTRLSSTGENISIIPALTATTRAPGTGMTRSRTIKVIIIPAIVPSRDLSL